MDLFIDAASGSGLSVQLFDQVRAGIISGRLRPGDRLVPSRQLAAQLGISRYTVTTAYGWLAAEGFLCGSAGGGSMVAEVPVAAGQRSRRRDAAIRPRRACLGLVPEAGPLADSGCRFDLRAGIPDHALFPAAEWRRQLNAAGCRPSCGGSPAGDLAGDLAGDPVGDPAGEPALRQAIARWVTRSRGVTADQDMVVVTSGVQHAIDLVARALLEPGQVVALEDPGYRPAARLLRSLGARVVGVPVDQDGLVVDQLPAAARVVYVTPSHQYPLGAVMSMPRRLQLLDWARRHGAAVIEDDYDSEFRHLDWPLEPLQRLDDTGRVIYLGSFSKTLSPALRLGFAVLPPPLAGPVAALRQLTDWHAPVAPQLALAAFIAGGLFDRHLRRSRRIYSRRHQILQSALSGPLAAALTSLGSSAGLHVTALLRAGLDEGRACEAAASRGVATTGLSQYYHARPGRAGLVLGFGAVTATDLPAALDSLGQALGVLPPDADRLA